MSCHKFGPELQAADGLPAIHLFVGLLGLLTEAASDYDGNLPQILETDLIRGIHVQAIQVHHTICHEIDVGQSSWAHEFGIQHKLSVNTLQQTSLNITAWTQPHMESLVVHGRNSWTTNLAKKA